MAKMLRKSLRAAAGVSPAAVWVLLQRGPAAAREVLGETLRAARKRGSEPVASPWDLVRAFAVDENIVLNSYNWFDGSMAPLERFLLAQLVRYFKPKTILEIGTFRGTTTRLFLDNAPSIARIYTIDLPTAVNPSEVRAATDARLIQHRKVGADFDGHPGAERVVQVFGSSLDSSTWEQIPRGIEFAFIDASHSYDAVRNDTERTFQVLAEGGVVAWHDYTEDESLERGVGKYLREKMATRKNIFCCSDTDLALRVPASALIEGRRRIAEYFPGRQLDVLDGEAAFSWLK